MKPPGCRSRSTTALDDPDNGTTTHLFRSIGFFPERNNRPQPRRRVFPWLPAWFSEEGATLMLLSVPLVAIHEPPFGPVGLVIFILAALPVVRERAAVRAR